MEIQSSRRDFLKMTGYTALGLACSSCSHGQESNPKVADPRGDALRYKRPNILFCISDDQSYPHAGIYGCKFVKTPAFDRVAKDGVLFHNAFVSAPSCCPSRSSILTGQDFYRLKEASMNHTIWPNNLRTYPDMLAQAGYYVGYTGKGWGPGDWKVSGQATAKRSAQTSKKHNPAGPEYNEHKMKPPTKHISPIDYARNFQAFLQKRPEGAPFCFWYGGVEPHRLYEQGSALRHGKKLEQAQVPAFMPDSEKVRSDILDYGLAIDWFDQHLGKIIRILEDIGELDNTLIVVTSDNGMPFPRAKATLYDYGTRMPLAVRWANKVKPGRVVEDFVSLVDFAPTFLEAASLPIPSEMTGKSLMKVLTSSESGQVYPSRDYAVFGIERHFPGGRAESTGYPMRAIRTKEYLYIKNYYPDRNPVGDHPGLIWPADDPVGGYGDIDGGPTKTYIWEHCKEYAELFRLTFAKRAAEELYDVRKDPYNLNNLANDQSYADVKNKLAAKLSSRLLETKDPRSVGKGHMLDDIMRRFPRTKTNR